MALTEGSPTVASAVWLLLFCWAAHFIAWRNNYYRLPNFPVSFLLPARYTLTAFVIYLAGTATIAPLLYLAIVYFREGSLAHSLSLHHLPAFYQTLLQMLFITLLFFVFVFYLFSLPKEVVSYLFSGNPKGKIFDNLWKNWQLGALTWMLSYPLVVFIGLIINALLESFFGKQEVHQVAVDQLKKTIDTPLLFSSLSFLVIFIVPFLEELLFRGFLQTYLRQKWGSIKSIFVSALFFAFFHFSKRQSLGNIELIVSLFILGSYLGFLYERQRTLWAPIGLHMTFNAISVIAIIVK